VINDANVQESAQQMQGNCKNYFCFTLRVIFWAEWFCFTLWVLFSTNHPEKFYFPPGGKPGFVFHYGTFGFVFH
jgi:hypothetical protein